jgi:prophage tail gpP-like protein
MNTIQITDAVGKVIETNVEYRSYSFDAQYDTIADGFTVSIAGFNYKISNWRGVNLIVNDNLVFTGIIEKKNRITDKDRNEIVLSGKDRGGILVEGYCKKFADYSNELPKDIIDDLISQTNFYPQPTSNYDAILPDTDMYSPNDIVDENASRLEDISNNKSYITRDNFTEYDASFTALGLKKAFKIEIGDRVWDKINDLVRSLGYEVLYKSTGGLFIGDLSKRRYNDLSSHRIVFNDIDSGNNAIACNYQDDISGRYSKVQVTTQSQNSNFSTTNNYIYKTKIASDNTLDYPKFFAITINDDETLPEKEAIRIRNDQLTDGLSSTYIQSGHTDEYGTIFDINRDIRIFDNINEINDDWVLYGCTYTFAEGEGYKTELRCGPEKKQVLDLESL